MEQASSDVIADIVAKETWTVEEHEHLLAGLFGKVDAPDKFKKILGELESADPEPKGSAALKIGIARYMLCRFQGALEALGEASDNKDRRYFQGMCLKALRRFESAVEEFQRAKDKGWEDTRVDLEIIECTALAGRLDVPSRALEKLKAALADSPDYFYLRGLIDELSGLGEQAADAYEQAREIDPGHAGATFRLAYYLDLHGQEDRALELYKQCLTQPPIYASALLNMSVLYEDLGQYDLALMCIERVLACNPTHPRARLFARDVRASKTMHFDEDRARRIAHRSALMDIPVTDFELSVRARNCLKKMNIRTLGDLVRTTEAELLGYKNFGETSLMEIKEMLEAKNLHLGQALEEGSELGEVLPLALVNVQNEGVLATPLDQIELSVRSRKALEALKVATLGELAGKTEAELLACRNFGQTSLTEVRERLGEYGLRLRDPL